MWADSNKRKFGDQSSGAPGIGINVPAHQVIEKKDAGTETKVPRQQTEQVRRGLAFLYLALTLVLALVTSIVGARAIIAAFGFAALVALFIVGYRATGRAFVPFAVCVLIGYGALEMWAQTGWALPEDKMPLMAAWAIGGIVVIAVPELLAIWRFAVEVVDQYQRKAMSYYAAVWPWTDPEDVVAVGQDAPPPEQPNGPVVVERRYRTVNGDHEHADRTVDDRRQVLVAVSDNVTGSDGRAVRVALRHLEQVIMADFNHEPGMPVVVTKWHKSWSAKDRPSPCDARTYVAALVDVLANELRVVRPPDGNAPAVTTATRGEALRRLGQLKTPDSG